MASGAINAAGIAGRCKRKPEMSNGGSSSIGVGIVSGLHNVSLRFRDGRSTQRSAPGRRLSLLLSVC